jgi:hypothetical protein
MKERSDGALGVAAAAGERGNGVGDREVRCRGRTGHRQVTACCGQHRRASWWRRGDGTGARIEGVGGDGRQWDPLTLVPDAAR